MGEQKPTTLEKTYLVMNVQAQNPEIDLATGKKTGKYGIVLQLLDESSNANTGIIKAVTFNLHEDEYKAIGEPRPPGKVKVVVTKL
jgi:hypothetical protein